MATPLDIGLLGKFGAIFPFLLVLVLVYAILSSVPMFGERKGLNALIALFLAILTIFSPTVRLTIERMAPWFVLFFFFLVFVAIAYMIFGAEKQDLANVLKTNTSVIYWILAIAVMIWIGSLTSVMSERGGVGVPTGVQDVVNATPEQVAAQDQQAAFWATLVHPKVLGMALILLIATFTVQRMTTF